MKNVYNHVINGNFAKIMIYSSILDCQTKKLNLGESEKISKVFICHYRDLIIAFSKIKRKHFLEAGFSLKHFWKVLANEYH